jgi:hypothetical protein
MSYTHQLDELGTPSSKLAYPCPDPIFSSSTTIRGNNPIMNSLATPHAQLVPLCHAEQRQAGETKAMPNRRCPRSTVDIDPSVDLNNDYARKTPTDPYKGGVPHIFPASTPQEKPQKPTVTSQACHHFYTDDSEEFSLDLDLEGDFFTNSTDLDSLSPYMTPFYSGLPSPIMDNSDERPFTQAFDDDDLTLLYDMEQCEYGECSLSEDDEMTLSLDVPSPPSSPKTALPGNKNM